MWFLKQLLMAWIRYRVDACEFDIAVITNITHEHLDYHGNYEGYLNAKFKLIDALVDTSEKENGNPRFAILNRDDISYSKINDRLIEARYHTINTFNYGLSDDAQINAENISSASGELDFDVKIFGQSFRVNSPLIGTFNVYNILAAISAAAIGLKLDIDCVIEWNPIDGECPWSNGTDQFWAGFHCDRGLCAYPKCIEGSSANRKAADFRAIDSCFWFSRITG